MFRKLHRQDAHSITVFIDNTPVEAERGETVAALLLRTFPGYACENTAGGGRRAPFCLMGVCFDCLAIVDGAASSRTCMVTVREGMRILRQLGPRALVK